MYGFGAAVNTKWGNGGGGDDAADRALGVPGPDNKAKEGVVSCCFGKY